MIGSSPCRSPWWLGMALCAVATGCASLGDVAADGRVRDLPDCGAGGFCPMSEPPDAGIVGPDERDADLGGYLGLESGDACFDGQDNDGVGAIDCGEASCQEQFRSCCVGRSTPGCCDAPVDVPALVLDGCTGTFGGGCPSAGLLPFGAPLPHVIAGELFPNGDSSYDSGVVVDTPIAPGRAITVRATLAVAPVACGVGCVEAAGVGLTAAPGYGSESNVRALVGLVVSASRRTLDLVLEGEVADRVALPTGETTFDVVLSLAPDGGVSAEGLPGGTRYAQVVRAGTLRLVAWGRNMNSTDLSGARVSALTASTSTCDAPAVWTERGPLVLGDGASVAPSIATAPSVADLGGESRLVFEAGGRIVLARRMSATDAYAVVGGYDNAALSDPDGGALHEPELVALPEGGWRVYVATQGGAIAYADGLVGGDVFTLRGLAVSPSELGATIARLDGPSVLPPSVVGGLWHLVVRALDLSGRSSLVHLTSSDGLTFTLPADGTLASATLRIPQGSFAAFDRDEVAAPEVFRHGGAVGVAYAGRSGARWSIGLLVSDDFAHVRPAPIDGGLGVGAILAASGVAADVDALSVSDPDVIVRAGRVELFYAGSDGVSTHLARVARPSLGGP